MMPKTKAIVRLDAESLFRFEVVSMVRILQTQGMTRSKAVTETAGSLHRCNDGGLRQVSKRSVYRWLAAFERDHIAGLQNMQRPAVATSKVLPPALAGFIEAQKNEDPHASIPELIRRAQEFKIIDPHQSISRSTVWRLCGRLNLSTRQRPHKHEADTRRFAHAHRMTVVLCDGKHFRVGPKRHKRVALTFLDDATRYGIHVVVGTSEAAQIFLQGLYETIRRVGYTDFYYLDHGPGFISTNTATVIANLGSEHK